jgi:class 3 adenylate cyclase
VTRPAKILVVDDTLPNVKLLADLLDASGYEVGTAHSGLEALEQVAKFQPDLVLLDIVMPDLDGYEVCRGIRQNPETSLLPVVMVTALDPAEERVKGIDAGADDFLTKPINRAELMARVRSLLRIRAMHVTIEEQAQKLAEWNRTLEQRVQEQLAELERVSRLKRFFSPHLAEAIVAGDAEDPLKPHRSKLTVTFLDIRGFTAFAESEEPEEMMAVLREFHKEIGHLIMKHQGTLERFTGDGMMIFFNDPIPIPNPEECAVRMALDMRESINELKKGWDKNDYGLGVGIGIANGYATIGAVGYEGRSDYAAIGSVTNLAARLCGEANHGQIIVSRRLFATVEDLFDGEPAGEFELKGFRRPITALNVRGPIKG